MSDRTTVITNIEKVPIQITRIRVKAGTTLYEGRIILFYQVDFDSPKKKTKQLKTKDAGVLCSILVQEGDVVPPGAGLYSYKSGCSHSTVVNDLCAECGFDLQKDEKMSTEASVPMVHAIPSLKVSEEQAMILGRADETRLIKDKKLVLLVDLDQTLIHTTNDNIDPNIKDIHHFQLNAGAGPRNPTWYHTRLRPGTHQFLASISKWFELHICTFGSRNYAHQIAHFLDQQGKYFSTRILSRDECFDAHSKTANLKALFPCGDNMVCIIDDREDVWNYALNLIHVKPYHFFRHTGDINAPPGLTKQDNDATQGYTCNQLAKGVFIKADKSSGKQNKKNHKDSVRSKDRKRKILGEPEDGRHNKENRRDKKTEEPTDEKKDDQVLISTNTSPSELEALPDSPPMVQDFDEGKIPSKEVGEEIKVLEEKINREIVSIVKIVRSNKSEDQIPVVDLVEDSTSRDRKLEFIPSTASDSDEIQYIPSTKSTKKPDSPPSTTSTKEQGSMSASHEYIPLLPEEDKEMEYVPTSTNENDEYVPTSTSKSLEGVVYEPSSAVKTDVYVPTQTSPSEEYVPESSAVIDTPLYTPTKTEELEYTPKPMEVEYVPPGIQDSIAYVPTSITETTQEASSINENLATESSGTKVADELIVAKCTESSGTKVADELIVAKCTESSETIVANEIKAANENGRIVSEINAQSKEESNDEWDVSKDSDEDSDDVGEVNDRNEFGEKLKEVEEVDDYLLYLEEILKHIHEKFYTCLDQMKERQEDGALPDLKSIIPAMRSIVLAGCHLVFSGVVPSKMRLEENKAYSVATSLGATVSDQIRPATTHLVAVRSGTAKMNDAKRRKDIQIVTLDWLWMCAERWERVDERLFPVLPHSAASSRTPPAHCASPPYTSSPPSPSPSPQFCDSINPLMTLTSEDLANMDREVEDIFNESDDEEEDSNESAKRKRRSSSDSSSVESLSGDRKGGFACVGQGAQRSERKRRKKRKRSRAAQEKEDEIDQDSGHTLKSRLDESDAEDATGNATSSDDLDSDPEADSDAGETINSKFRRCAALPSDLEFESSQDSATEDATGDADEWGLMGAALEREFSSDFS